MELTLWIVIELILMLTMVLWRRQCEIIHLLTFGLAVFFMFYVIISTCLFGVGVFSIRRALVVELLISVALLAFVWGMSRRQSRAANVSNHLSASSCANQDLHTWDGNGVGQSAVLSIGKCQVHAASLASSWPMYILIAILVVAAQGSFGFFGMGQDQGVYQTEAINLYYDHNSWRESIHDFDDVTDVQYKEYAIEQVEQSLGFDVLTDPSLLREAEVVQVTGLSADGDLDGFWHGIPSYAAMLGLWARMFGIDRMMELGAVFYVLTVLVFLFALQELHVVPGFQFLLTLLFGICPQLVWQKKASLTEGFTALLVVVYLYCILWEAGKVCKGREAAAGRGGLLLTNSRIGTADGNRDIAGGQFSGAVSMSVLPVAAFCFFHVSVYCILPVFLVNYWVLYETTAEKRFLRNAIETALIYFAGFEVIVHIQPRYVILNYYLPLHVIPMNRISFLAAGGTLLAVLLSLWMWKVRSRRNKKKQQEDSQAAAGKAESSLALPGARTQLLFCWLYRLGVVAMALSIIYELAVRNVAPTTLTIYCYLILSGIVSVPLICWKLFRGKTSYSLQQILVCNMFFWTVLVFSIMMKPTSAYYYYYTRYLAPYISVILVCFASLYGNKIFGDTILRFSGDHSSDALQPQVSLHDNRALAAGADAQAKAKAAFQPETRIRTNRVGLFVAVAVGMVCLLPFTWVVLRNQDDTCMQWNELTELLSQVDSQDVVYLDDTYMLTMYHTLRAKGARVYPVENGQITQAMAAVPDVEEGTVYYLTEGNDAMAAEEAKVDSAAGSDRRQRAQDAGWFQVVYRNTSQAQEDDLSAENILTGLPYDFARRSIKTYVLQKQQRPTPVITTADDAAFVHGFAGVNDAGFRWMNAQEAVLATYLEPESYEMIIHAGDVIPFDQISADNIHVTVLCNDKEVGTLEFTKDNWNQDVSVAIPARDVDDGLNRIRFVADTTWSPAEYGSEDTSTYVFSLSSIEFVKSGKE